MTVFILRFLATFETLQSKIWNFVENAVKIDSLLPRKNYNTRFWKAINRKSNLYGIIQKKELEKLRT